MSLLLDTHVFLWAVMQPEKLSASVRERFEDPATELIVSAASAWEIATKHRLGKLPSAAPVVAQFDDVVARLHARVLAVTHRHALLAGGFEFPHRDPFDRILAAQAQLEQVWLVSKDPALSGLGAEVIW